MFDVIKGKPLVIYLAFRVIMDFSNYGLFCENELTRAWTLQNYAHKMFLIVQGKNVRCNDNLDLDGYCMQAKFQLKILVVELFEVPVS